MNSRSIYKIICLLLIANLQLFGQIDLSPLTISYKLTFDQTTNDYTVWVVPNYNTPNIYNAHTYENLQGVGSTQVTIAVPCDADINSISDIKASWIKPGEHLWQNKYGPAANTPSSSYFQNQGLDPTLCYFTIFTVSDGSNLGNFTKGVPVALFKFTTSKCVSPIKIIEPNDPIVDVAMNVLQWGIGNSFSTWSSMWAYINTYSPSWFMQQFSGVIGSPANCSSPIMSEAENTSTPMGTAVVQNILINDLNNGMVATVSNVNISTTQPQCGAVSINAMGQAVYTPTSACTGTQSYTYTICDKANPSLCSSSSNSIIIGGNIIANPENSTLTIGNGLSVSQSVLTNDILNGQTPTASSVNLSISSQPSCGSVSLDANTGVITYFAASTCMGSQNYTYQICDKLNTNNCYTTTNTILISPPVILAGTETLNYIPNTPTTFSILNNDTNNGLQATLANVDITIISQPRCGSISLNSQGQVILTPTTFCQSFSGSTDGFVYQICDKNLKSACYAVYDEIKNVSSTSIIAYSEPNLNTNSNVPYTQTVLANDLIYGQTATINNVNISIITPPTCGSITINANGEVVYMPNSSCSGAYSYTYQICDKANPSVCNTATNNLNVISSSTLILANSDIYTTKINTPITFDVLLNDNINGTIPTAATVDLTLVSQPSCGTAVLNKDKTITFTPSNNGVVCPQGNYCLTYQICEKGTVNCAISYACIQVTCTNIVASTDAVFVTNSRSPTITNVLANDLINNASANISNVKVSILNAPTNGSATLNADGSISYLPFASNSSTSDSYIYQICDILNPICCSNITNYITFNSNTTIVAVNDNFCTTTGASKNMTVLANDTRNNLPVLYADIILTITSPPTKGGATINSDGTITYTANSSFAAAGDYFIYQICDKLQPSICSSAVNTIANCNNATTDIEVIKTVNNVTSVVGGNLSYTISVKNKGAVNATNILISEQINSTDMTLLSSTPSIGSYDPVLGNWAIPSLASGANVTLTIATKIQNEGVLNNTAKLTSFDGVDTNSANNSSTVCTSVPVSLCQGKSLNLNVPPSYTNVVWSRNGIVVGSGNSYSVTSAGSYSWSADNNTCPASGCCPLVVNTEICCANATCIPVTILK